MKKVHKSGLAIKLLPCEQDRKSCEGDKRWEDLILIFVFSTCLQERGLHFVYSQSTCNPLGILRNCLSSSSSNSCPNYVRVSCINSVSPFYGIVYDMY